MRARISSDPDSGLVSVSLLDDQGQLVWSRLLNPDEARRVAARVFRAAEEGEAAGRTSVNVGVLFDDLE